MNSAVTKSLEHGSARADVKGEDFLNSRTATS